MKGVKFTNPSGPLFVEGAEGATPWRFTIMEFDSPSLCFSDIWQTGRLGATKMKAHAQ